MTGECKTQEGCCRREGFLEEERLSVERNQTRMKRDCIRLAERRSRWNGKGGHETTVRTESRAVGCRGACRAAAPFVHEGRLRRRGGRGPCGGDGASEDGGAGT